jgi:hypothetical protein
MLMKELREVSSPVTQLELSLNCVGISCQNRAYMKKMLFPFIPLFILGSALVVAAGCAHQNSEVQNQEKNKEEYLTGSYIPQSVDRNGPVTNGKNDVRVIDGSDIDRSGGANVQQSLRQLGVTH